MNSNISNTSKVINLHGMNNIINSSTTFSQATQFRGEVFINDKKIEDLIKNTLIKEIIKSSTHKHGLSGYIEDNKDLFTEEDFLKLKLSLINNDLDCQ